MNRREVLTALDSIVDMSDREIAINAKHIREVAQFAYNQIKTTEHCITENRKLRAAAKLQHGRD